jgi:predicted dehydrogenase
VVFLPAFVYRFREDIQLLFNKVIAQNCIGNIQHMHAFWIRKNGIPRPGSWYTNKKLSGGGVLVDIGSHILDICLMILKDFEHHNIDAWTWNNKETKSKGPAEWFKNDNEYNDAIDVEDNAVSKILLANGITLTIGVKWKSAVKNDFTYFRIQGDNGWIELKTLFGFSPDRLWPTSLISLYDKNNLLKERIKIDDNDKINPFLNLNKYFLGYINKPNKFLVDEDILKIRRLIHEIYNTKNKNSSLDNEINVFLSSIIN